MPKRQKQHVVGHYKKPKMMDNVEQVEEKLLKEQESLKEIEKNLSKEKSKIAHLDELIVHSKKKIAKYKKEKEQAECCRSETEQQLAAKTKQILKLQSIKSEFLFYHQNPERLNISFFTIYIKNEFFRLFVESCHVMSRSLR